MSPALIIKRSLSVEDCVSKIFDIHLDEKFFARYLVTYINCPKNFKTELFWTEISWDSFGWTKFNRSELSRNELTVKFVTEKFLTD